jgi:hypothetical protein
MTQDLLSSLDTTIAQTRARAIATHAYTDVQQKQRFAAYDAYAAGLKSTGGGSTNRKSKQSQGSRQFASNSGSASGPGWLDQVSESLEGQQADAHHVDHNVPSHSRNTRAQGRKAATTLGEMALGMIDRTNTAEGSSRIRT